MTKKAKRKTASPVGSSFDDFLAEEGMLESSTATAVKRVLAWQLQQEMEQRQLTKTAMAAEMKTSRLQLDRLLDPNNLGVSLETLQRAASVIGKDIRIGLV
ncbi:MAG: XRE family transcriptional regulator [Cyanothece sp. SIO1E1]|nr:XRE family transcriptional regulator [Cyanothece sp. SIO1E1]